MMLGFPRFVVKFLQVLAHHLGKTHCAVAVATIASYTLKQVIQRLQTE